MDDPKSRRTMASRTSPCSHVQVETADAALSTALETGEDVAEPSPVICTARRRYSSMVSSTHRHFVGTPRGTRLRVTRFREPNDGPMIRHAEPLARALIVVLGRGVPAQANAFRLRTVHLLALGEDVDSSLVRHARLRHQHARAPFSLVGHWTVSPKHQATSPTRDLMLRLVRPVARAFNPLRSALSALWGGRP